MFPCFGAASLGSVAGTYRRGGLSLVSSPLQSDPFMCRPLSGNLAIAARPWREPAPLR